MIIAWGETKPAAEWARDPRCAVSRTALWHRLKSGWEPERAISVPSRLTRPSRTEKACTKCGETKPLEQFSRLKRNKTDGRAPQCKECSNAYVRNWWATSSRDRDAYRARNRAWYDANSDKVRNRSLQRNYNITLDQYEAMLESQDGACVGCLRLPNSKSLGVDHNHACCSGERSCGECVRGLLCNNCNSVLGWARDDPETLRRLADYLGKYLLTP